MSRLRYYPIKQSQPDKPQHVMPRTQTRRYPIPSSMQMNLFLIGVNLFERA